MIYIYQNGIVLGEFTIDAVKNGLELGTFSLKDWGWRSGMKEWKPLERLIEAFPNKARRHDHRTGDTMVIPHLEVERQKKESIKDKLTRRVRLL